MIKIRINHKTVGTYLDLALQSQEKLFVALKLHLVQDWDRIEVVKIADKNKQISRKNKQNKAKIDKNVLQKT